MTTKTILQIRLNKEYYTKDDILEIVFNENLVESTVFKLIQNYRPLMEVVGIIGNIHYCVMLTANPYEKIFREELLQNIEEDIEILGLKSDLQKMEA